MNILIIDDDAEDREFFCDALHEAYPDAVCVGVSSCEKVGETIARVNPDIIFMDGHMQPITGAEWLGDINKFIYRRKNKYVIHSGSLSPVELQEFEKAGVDHVLLKASSFEELKTNIMYVVEKFHPDHVRQADHDEKSN